MPKKEYKIGEEFQCGLVRLKCVSGLSCESCYFKGIDYCCTVIYDMVGGCDSSEREDKTNVAFVKVEQPENSTETKRKHIFYTGILADYYSGELRFFLSQKGFEFMQHRVEGKDEYSTRPVIIIELETKSVWIQYCDEEISEFNPDQDFITCDVNDVERIIKEYYGF